MGGTEAFPDLGKHCEREDCGQLDFLPFSCDGCLKVFCKDHRSYADHDCPKADHKSRIVVLCTICDASVDRRHEENDDVALARHISQGNCDPSKKRALKCPIKGCREKLTFSNTTSCKSCRQRLCLKHRFPDAHFCGRATIAFKKRDPPSPPAIRVY